MTQVDAAQSVSGHPTFASKPDQFGITSDKRVDEVVEDLES